MNLSILFGAFEEDEKHPPCVVRMSQSFKTIDVDAPVSPKHLSDRGPIRMTDLREKDVLPRLAGITKPSQK